jgi:transposase-like protein
MEVNMTRKRRTRNELVTLREDVITMFEAGAPTKDIADELEISDTYVRKLLHDVGFDARQLPGIREIVSPEIAEKVAAMYLDPVTEVSDILGKYKLTYNQLYKVLRTQDVRPVDRAVIADDRLQTRLQTAVEMYDDEYRVKEIEATTGINKNLLYRHLQSRRGKPGKNPAPRAARRRPDQSTTSSGDPAP